MRCARQYDDDDVISRPFNQQADFVNADPSDVVLVQNATAGMNAVLQSMAGGKGGVLQPGDRVFMLDTGSVQHFNLAGATLHTLTP